MLTCDLAVLRRRWWALRALAGGLRSMGSERVIVDVQSEMWACAFAYSMRRRWRFAYHPVGYALLRLRWWWVGGQ